MPTVFFVYSIVVASLRLHHLFYMHLHRSLLANLDQIFPKLVGKKNISLILSYEFLAFFCSDKSWFCLCYAVHQKLLHYVVNFHDKNIFSKKLIVVYIYSHWSWKILDWNWIIIQVPLLNYFFINGLNSFAYSTQVKNYNRKIYKFFLYHHPIYLHLFVFLTDFN